ncbi:ribonuclease H-like domain-containing protein [Aspergillus cavernicola]|uniref:Ribonuclease H-like domain-containing protein n=1 Tax=Aspergillus cavernicola TaxID=176166 RepID=A0ABR4ILX7_9EURO
MERNRSIAGTKRLYSCRSAPWKTVSTVFNKSSSTGTQRDRKSTGSRISKSYSSQDRVLKINLPSQQVSSSLQPTNQPTSQFWSHRLYKDEDGKDLVIHYCKSLETTEKVAKLFLNDKLLGLDLEWKAQASASDSIQSNVSVIQFASQNRIALFQIARFMPGKTLEHLVSPTLKRILESSDVTKVGVTIKADCTRLRKYLGIDPHSIFELSHLHKLIKYCHVNPKLINKRPVSLNEQVEEHFGLPLEKDVDVRCSNWTGSLTYRQVHYAAADAYANYQLFQTMDAKRKALNPTPPLPAHAELNLPIRTVPEPEVSVDLESNGIETIDPVNNAEKPEGCSQSI